MKKAKGKKELLTINELNEICKMLTKKTAENT